MVVSLVFRILFQSYVSHVAHFNLVLDAYSRPSYLYKPYKVKTSCGKK